MELIKISQNILFPTTWYAQCAQVDRICKYYCLAFFLLVSKSSDNKHIQSFAFLAGLCVSLTCAFFSRSVNTENQSGVSASSSKVMMAKANVEPLNCQSWWHAIQCCTCLVHSAAWKPGGVFWCPSPTGSTPGSVESQPTPEPCPMDGMRWGWLETSRAWN